MYQLRSLLVVALQLRNYTAGRKRRRGGTVTGLWARRGGFNYRQGQGFFLSPHTDQSRDSSVGIVLGYGLDDRGSRVRFPAGAGNFYLHHRVQNGYGAHPASYPIGSRGSFPGGKAARA
jgi:hypothetical protein